MFTRNRVELPEGLGFRWIVEEDCDQDFKCCEPRMDRYTLADYYQWSKEANSLVIVREVEERIVGILYLTAHQSYIMVEMLARNKLLNYPGTGANLLRVVERSVAPQLGVKEVRLEALSDVVAYYDDELGYAEYGIPFSDGEWGELTPKRKLIS